MRRALVSLLLASVAFLAAPLDAAPLKLEKGDHICVIGNALAERMQHSGWLETLINARYPKHELVFRNMGYSGDEVNGWRDLYSRMRSMDFGSQDQWLAGKAPIPQPSKLNKSAPVRQNRLELTNTRADVIFAFYGYNESFAGEAGLNAFRDDLRQFIRHTLAQRYNGKSAPRLVLFSPIAHENLGDPNLPDGTQDNKRLERYTAAMSEVARAEHVPFVDLFSPTRPLFEKRSSGTERLPHAGGLSSNDTIDGIHLNETGDAEVARIAYRVLFGENSDLDGKQIDAIRRAVNDKNWFWFERYRATDGYSSYGDRAFLRFVNGQTNYEVVQRELEVIDRLTSNRDRVIWAAAQGRTIKPDDSNLPPFIPVISNKPGPLPGGKHVFLSGEDEIKRITMHHGMKVNLFASEAQFPELVNPVQMAFDTRGRLWVAAWHTYPHWKPTEPMDDKLLILEDTDGDGRADKCTTFAGDLTNPTGFEFWGGGVIVAQGPDILFLKDTNGDDHYDVKERIIHGMDTADTHHTSNSFVLDPGGALYWQEGTFHHTQVETPWGPPVRCANAGVYRYEPRTKKFSVYVTYGFANPHGHVFDRWGQDIVIDGTGAVPYHAPLFSSRLDFPKKHAQPPTVYKQRTRPCPGIEILSSRHFPEELQGNLIVPNVIGFQGILCYKLFDQGSSFGAKEVEPILSSSDPNFRPADVEIAPDGSLYFTDWHNPIIGHMQHNLRDPNRDRIHGRVYRVTYPSRPLEKPAAIAGQPIDALLERLEDSDDRVRSRARIELSARDTASVIAAARQWIQKWTVEPASPNSAHHLLEGLWLFQSHNVVDSALLERVLHSPDERARAAAVRVCAAWQDRLPHVVDLLRTAAVDSSARVRLMAIWAASFVPRPEVAEVVLLAQEQPGDPYLSFLAREAMRTLGPQIERARAEHRPIVFETQAGVRYLLRSLSHDELLKQPRDRNVLWEILTRPGMAENERRQALVELAPLEKQGELRILQQALLNLDRRSDGANAAVAAELLHLLTNDHDRKTADAIADHLVATAQWPVLRQLIFAALVNRDGQVAAAWNRACLTTRSLRDFVDAVPFISDASVRASLDDRLEALLEGLPQSMGGTRAPKMATATTPEEEAAIEIRQAAMRALPQIRGQEGRTFERLAKFVIEDVDRMVAIRALQSIPRIAWPKAGADRLVTVLVTEIRKTPARRRTTPQALDTFEFADALTTLLPPDDARSIRAQLRELGVRVVKIATVFERMAYDQETIAVQAGKPVEFLLENHDLMPHNFVIVKPGTLERVGLFSEAHAQDPAFAARQYVPKLPDVLAAGPLLQAHSREKIHFRAPAEPGVYPFVCTYPGHWRRMFGALYVVRDLDRYLADPPAYVAREKLEPRDPLLQDRRPRTEWTFQELASSLHELEPGSGPGDAHGSDHGSDHGSHGAGRNFGSGKQAFTSANCVACHHLGDAGNSFGPDLTKLDPKWTPADVLTSILTPSARINEKFQSTLFELESGKTVSGLVVGETPDTIRVIENPLIKAEPITLRRSDIASRQVSKTSMMPKGLLDKLTRDEILDLVAYVFSGARPQSAYFKPAADHRHAHLHSEGRSASSEPHGH